ncbi:hypothetical protein ACIRPQ_29125 [Streptomyces sp. NPDC101213]|uniref:hypothetical protein n=1 Tax=Streptomyces sp. NPDC101213 TaxID=3366130 RepID=UPI003814C379
MTSTEASAAELESALADAVSGACYAGRVYVPENDPAALCLVLLSQHRLSFNPEPQETRDWLERAGIEAAVHVDETFNAVVTMRSANSVRQVIDRVFAPYVRVEWAADGLRDVLASHGVDATVRSYGPRGLGVYFSDTEGFACAVRLAELLGVPDIAEGLKLGRPRGMRRLAERVRWVLAGVTGGAVGVQVFPGCVHEPDGVEVRLGTEQAAELGQRLVERAGDW